MSSVSGCPRCGSINLVRDGFSYQGGQRVQRFLCNGCGMTTTNPIQVKQPTISPISFNQFRELQSLEASSKVYTPKIQWWLSYALLGRPNINEVLQQLVNEAAEALAGVGVRLERGEIPASAQLSFLVLTPPQPNYVVEAHKALERVIGNYSFKVSASSFFNLAEGAYYTLGPGGPQTANLMKIGAQPQAPNYRVNV